jgi:hypothetical protein
MNGAPNASRPSPEFSMISQRSPGGLPNGCSDVDVLWEPRSENCNHSVYYDLDEIRDPCPLCGSITRLCLGYAVCWRCWTLVAWRSWWLWREQLGELPAMQISAFWLGPWNVTQLHYNPDLVIVLDYELLSQWSFGSSPLLATFEEACRYAAGAFLVPWTRRQAHTVAILQSFDIPIIYTEDVQNVQNAARDVNKPTCSSPTQEENAKQTGRTPRIRTWLRRVLGHKGLRHLKRTVKSTCPSLQWIWGARVLLLVYEQNRDRDMDRTSSGTGESVETLLANVCSTSCGFLSVLSFQIQETMLQVLRLHAQGGEPVSPSPSLGLHQWVQHLGHKYLVYVASGTRFATVSTLNKDAVDSTCCVLYAESAWRARTVLQETLGRWGVILPRGD